MYNCSSFVFDFLKRHIFIEDKIIDIGCGSGAYTKKIYPLNKNIVAFDQIRTVSLKEIPYICGDIKKLCFKDKSFQLILCITVLQYLEPESINGILHELNNILSDKGKLILTLPVPYSTFRLAKELSLRLKIYPYPPVKKYHTISFMRGTLKRNGFKIIRISGIGLGWSISLLIGFLPSKNKLGKLLKKIEEMIPDNIKRTLCWHYVIVAQKSSSRPYKSWNSISISGYKKQSQPFGIKTMFDYLIKLNRRTEILKYFFPCTKELIPYFFNK